MLIVIDVEFLWHNYYIILSNGWHIQLHTVYSQYNFLQLQLPYLIDGDVKLSQSFAVSGVQTNALYHTHIVKWQTEVAVADQSSMVYLFNLLVWLLQQPINADRVVVNHKYVYMQQAWFLINCTCTIDHDHAVNTMAYSWQLNMQKTYIIPSYCIHTKTWKLVLQIWMSFYV